MSENEKKLIKIDGVTDAAMKAWRERYGEDKVEIVTLKNEHGTKELIVVIRKPDRITKGKFETYMDKNMGKARDILITNCLLSHKEEVLADDDLYEAATEAISSLFAKGSFEKN